MRRYPLSELGAAFAPCGTRWVFDIPQPPHWVDKVFNSMSFLGFPVHIFCTLRSRKPKIGRHLRDFDTHLYWILTTLRRRAGLGPENALGGESKQKIPGRAPTNQGLGRPKIRVITFAWTGEASRASHPRRSGASVCSANGRSATRPDRSARTSEP